MEGPRITRPSVGIALVVAFCASTLSGETFGQVGDLGHCVLTGSGEFVVEPSPGTGLLVDICTGQLYEDTDPGPGDGRLDSCCCGNGTLEPIEQCDDGNTAAGDGCSPLCMIEPAQVPAVSAGSTAFLIISFGVFLVALPRIARSIVMMDGRG